MAHPVRLDSFVEINNFYTATVYEKGAEVIGMLKRLVGDAAYCKALDLYFERHDGDAATIALNQTGFIGDQKAWKIDHDQRKFWEPFFPKKYGPAQCG